MTHTRPSISSLLMLFAFDFLLATAQSPIIIGNISTNSVVDLYKMYHGDAILDVLTPSLFQWNYYNDEGPISRGLYTFDESLEIMKGPAEIAGDEVVDIAFIHIMESNRTLFSAPEYLFPASLPLGLYHARINATLNQTTSAGKVVVQHATARTSTINVTTSSQIGCGSKVPAPFKPLTSPNSSDFTSLHVVQPCAGFNVVIDPSDPDGVMNIEWIYRDFRNIIAEGAGISNLTVQVIDNTTLSEVGSQWMPVAIQSGLVVKFSDVPMKEGGAYKLLIRYYNNVTDGTVSPGNEIQYISPDFNVMLAEDLENNCANFAASDLGPGNSTGGSPSTGKSNSQSTSAGFSGKWNKDMASVSNRLTWVSSLLIYVAYLI